MKETTVKLVLDMRESSKRDDGSYPLKLKLGHKENYKRISIGEEFGLKKEDWNEKKKEIRASVENAGRLRAKCSDKLRIANRVIDHNAHLLRNLTIEQLKKLIVEALGNPELSSSSFESVEQVEKTVQSISLKEWCKILANRKTTSKKHGTTKWYNDSANAFLKFYGADDIDLKEISKTLLEDWKAHHLGKGLKVGGINTRLRGIRAILNSASNEGKLVYEKNAFCKTNINDNKVKIPAGKPEKRSIDAGIITSFKKLYKGEKIGKIQLKPGSSDWHCICEGLYIWETYAMNFIDLVKLKVKDAFVDVISYDRSKNGSKVEVINSELSLEIASYYAKGKKPEDYLFRYKWEDSEVGYNRYLRQRNRWNIRMTRIAKDMGYGKITVSPYSIRHTFASEVNKNGVTRDLIGEMFGHTDGRSIDTYISKKDIKILNDKARTALQHI